MNKTALLFAGQGAQVVGMGRDMAEASSSARQWFEQADQALGCDLSRICFQGPEADLTRTEYAQPGIYLVGWVAFQLLKERLPGLDFHATAGLSLGEFTALAAAGVFSFEDGIRVVRQRGRFMQEACEAQSGGMAAIIGLDEESTRAVCELTGATLANLNCPGQIVISGPASVMEKACEAARSAGAKKAMPLKVAGAYHSPLMAPAQPSLKAALARVSFSAPIVPTLSNVTAMPHDPTQVSSRLVEQVTAPVRWEACMRWMLQNGYTRFIELGPGKALSGFMKRIDDKVQMLNVSDMASLETTVQALSASPNP
ncbi:MAG: ACP S-malonyltransferase [Verrucomicrobia bacterium]|nr:ACP S-malonyltransferase [Verrucomicrobiota bacterium]